MDYLKILRENPNLAEEFDSLFDFFLLDELSPRDEADGRATFTLPGMAFARDGSGGEYHLLEDGSIGYYSSEGETGRLAESMDDLFSLLVSCICWHDCCDTKQYVDSKTLEEYGQRQRNCNLEDMDMLGFYGTLHCVELQRLEIVGYENPCHAIVEALAKKLEELLAGRSILRPADAGQIGS